MMTWWLVVFVLVEGQWMPGDEVTPQGWSPRAYDSRAECLERRDFAREALTGLEDARTSKWFCTRDPESSLAALEAEAEL